jgi:hypothetical protein
MKLAAEGAPGARALRFDFRFVKGGGYAVARRAVDLMLPENYAFVLRLRGNAPPENLELKLIDDTGENVWWCNRRDVQFPKTWQTLVTKKRQIPFAWGPKGGGEIHHVAAIEIAVTAGSGGQGTVWLDDLELRTLLPPSAPVAPIASASSVQPGHGASFAVDTLAGTWWEPRLEARHPWLQLDLGGEREVGGLVIDWAPSGRAHGYVVQGSEDGRAWQALREVRGNFRQRDYLRLPETDARYLRLTIRDYAGMGRYGIASIQVKPLEWGATPEVFYQAIAREAPRGDYPRGILGEQPYWTVVGVDGDTQEALMSEDGAIEVGKRGFSLEPFLYADGKLWAWSNVTAEDSLVGGHLPIPTVRWRGAPLELEVLAFPMRAREGSSIVARYRVTNRRVTHRQAKLYLAIRPFQVNPPTQFLNTAGGTSPIREVLQQRRLIRVNGDRGVIPLSAPTGFGTTPFDEGDITSFLRRGKLPTAVGLGDSTGFASAALEYRLDLRPGESAEVDLLLPLHDVPSQPPANPGPVGAQLDAAVKQWRRATAVGITLPGDAESVVQDLEAQIGYVLVNRDGAAIQPGSRSYERSWIRDGALTSSAMLRAGRADVVREFLEWFAKYQYENGKVPCCVDHRGADPTAELDSGGELIYLVAEYTRYTGDRDLAGRMWPQVRAAAAYLDSLRQERRTAEYRTPAKREFFGLLPPSISHEGYSAKPMHSYWDDLFALRGFKDAECLARTLGIAAEATRWARVRAEFERELRASVTAAMARHGIDYMPGCADLGDFDATSTTIALNPVQAGSALPETAVRATFEKYWKFFVARRDDREPWEAFTPYEIRNVGAFVRLGWRERANELLDWFRTYRRPAGFRQWAEVVWHDERLPRFIGDMPHTWVGTDYVRSVLDMLAWERERDDALIVGAGVRQAWVDEAPGVAVEALSTRWGKLDFTMRRAGSGVEVRLGGDLHAPRGGIVVAPPGVTARWKATVNGVRAPITSDGRVVVRKLPATVLLSP